MTSADPFRWPAIPLAAWRDTCATLHMWTQIAGKIRMACAPPVNHWWHVPFYLTARGLTTSPMPHGSRTFQIDFDFLSHQLTIQDSKGSARTVALEPRPVADFYEEALARLRELQLDVRIWPMPVEVADPIPFPEDRQHASYDREAVERFWQALSSATQVLQTFRGRFLGKCSPVHFFWGAFDLAVTRFSGRLAPPHPGIPGVSLSMVREAYSHEVSSCGFWPGGGVVDDAAFYAYAYPEPPGFREAEVGPAEAFYSVDLGEFVLPYEAVRAAADPEGTLTGFLQATYEAAADLGGWDRTALERPSDLARSGG